MAAGPPASALLYVLAPEKMIGWNLKPREAELPYLLPSVRNLPEIGRLTGRGNTANLETVMAAKPDVIMDFGSVNATYVSLADRVQNQTGIAYLLIDGRFDDTVGALRMLGSFSASTSVPSVWPGGRRKSSMRSGGPRPALTKSSVRASILPGAPMGWKREIADRSTPRSSSAPAASMSSIQSARVAGWSTSRLSRSCGGTPIP
jgi:hypothetical protein